MTTESEPGSRPPVWHRFLIFFPLMAIGFRKELLAGLGFADVRWPRWIFAGVMAMGVVSFTILSNPDPVSRDLATRSQVLRTTYKTLSLVVSVAFLFAVFAHLSVFNPIFWIAALLLIAVVTFDIARRRSLARQAKSLSPRGV